MNTLKLILILVTYSVYADTLPECKCSQIIHHKAFTVCYSDSMKESKWSAYRLFKSQLMGNKSPRTNKFLADPMVTSTKVTYKDYAASGYDKGHMSPAEDFSYDPTAEAECFYMTNMMPQLPSCNRGIWKKLEIHVRAWAWSDTNLLIITGPVLGPVSMTIGINKVMVPTSCFKLVVGATSYVAYIVPNASSSDDINKFKVPVGDITKQTGIDFSKVIGNRKSN